METQNIIKNIITCSVLAVLLFVLAGCGSDNSYLYKDIADAVVPDECAEYKDDTCSLFDCMIDSCWCDDSSPDLPILYETLIAFNNEQGAIDAVNVYKAELIYNGPNDMFETPENWDVQSAVKLNDIFYNVFVDNNEEELVFTVAVDGTIIKTICGV